MKIAALAILCAAASLAPDPEAMGQWETRDNLLLEHAWGRALVESYYRWTPLATLPLADPSERPQKLALLAVEDGTDRRNLTTYLADRGYLTESCAPGEAERLLAEGGHELVVLEMDADREDPRRVQEALARRHPSLARSALVAFRAGTGKALVPAATAGLPCLALPFRDPRKLWEAMYRASRSPEPLRETRLFIRLGSSPPLIAGALGVALLLLLASLACLAPGRVRVAGATLLLLVVLGGIWTWRGTAEAPGGPLSRMAALRGTLAAHPDKARLSEEELDFLVAQLGSPTPRLQREAAYTWAVAGMVAPGDGRRVEALMGALGDQALDFRTRQWAAVALGLDGGSAAVPALSAALKDPAFLVRGKAGEALGRIRDPRAISALLQMAREDLWYNAMIARDALRQMGRGAGAGTCPRRGVSWRPWPCWSSCPPGSGFPARRPPWP